MIEKYLQREISKIRNSSKGKNPLNKSMYSSYLFNGNPIATFNNYTQDIVAGYMSNETVYSIVNKIATTASAVPIKLIDVNGKEINNWASRLLKMPNEDYTFQELYKAFLIYYLTIGNGYLYAPKLSNSSTMELDIMPAADVVAISGGWNEPVRGYKLYIGTQEIEIPKSDVMRMSMFNPSFNQGMFIYGLSPVTVAADIINNLNAGEKRMYEMLDKGIPPYVISAKTNDGLTQQQQELLEKKYKEKYGTNANPNNPLLSGVELKIDKLGFSAQDLSLIENSQYGLRVLCSVYGVDSKMFNDPAASTFNNLKQVEIDFYNNTIKPLNKMFADKLSAFLLRHTNYSYEFDYSEVAVLGEAKADLMVKYNGIGFLTTDEKRKAFNLEPSNELNTNKNIVNDEQE